jgi:hypothetical protein
LKTQSADTDPVIERMQISGLRRLTPGQRFQMANSLTRTVFALSWDNFRRKHAELDENEACFLWVRLLYGDDMAQRVITYIERHKRPPTA